MKSSDHRIIWHELSDATELANALAHALHTQTLLSLRDREQVLIGLAGGSTPMAAYAEFALARVPWSNIHLCLIDERFVPITDVQSNERNIATAFVAVKSQLAGWHGLYHEGLSIEQSALLANQEHQALNQPMDLVVIGMGADGHIASLFIESEDYANAMNPDGDVAVVPIRFTQESEKINRLSFSLVELLKAKKALICITGDDKRMVIHQSMDGSRPDYAVAQFLKSYQNPVEIFWSPA